MEETLDLKQKYPKIFQNIHWANYGFPPTWAKLVDNLCNEIQTYCDENRCEQIECEQIKEKFGTLRFYVDSAPLEVYDIIRKYENKSATICQMCGCTDCDVSAVGSWIKYLCNACKIVVK